MFLTHISIGGSVNSNNEPMDLVTVSILRAFGTALIIGLLSSCATSNSDTAGALKNCPQPRFTEKAPEPTYRLINPLQKLDAVVGAGEELYQKTAGKVSCMKCHGKQGDGFGAMAKMFDPPPRNFRCVKTINGVTDGQLFWIIKHGSPGTSMPAFDHLSEQQIWQLVHYIRELAKEPGS